MHVDHINRLAKARTKRWAPGQGLQEAVILDRHEILKTNRVGLPGHERAVEREAIAAVDRGVPGVLVGVEAVVLEFVDLLEVPRESALGAVDLEGVLALRAHGRATGLESSGGTVLKPAQHRREVLVLHRPGRITRIATAVVAGCPRRQRSLGDDGVAHADDLADAAHQELRHRHRVTKDVAGHSITRLVEHETPREQTHRIAAVHRQEASTVVRDLTELTGRNEFARMQHQWRPQVVVAHAGRDTRGLSKPVGLHRLLRLATDGLLTEHCLASSTRCLDHRHVQHVGGRDPHSIDVRGGNRLSPVIGSALEPKVAHCTFASIGLGVGADHKRWCDLAIREERRDTQRRTTVRLTHPSQAQNGNAYVHSEPPMVILDCGVRPAAVVHGKRGSGDCCAHDSRIQ